jgi:hypothetical protein
LSTEYTSLELHLFFFIISKTVKACRKPILDIKCFIFLYSSCLKHPSLQQITISKLHSRRACRASCKLSYFCLILTKIGMC